MAITRKTVRITDFEQEPLDRARIRCKGLELSGRARVWIDATTSPKKSASPRIVFDQDVDPKLKVDDAPPVEVLKALASGAELGPLTFPIELSWEKLPPLAIGAFESMRAMNDMGGYDGYCETLAGIQMTSVARLDLVRLRGGKVRIRLRLGADRTELTVPAADLAPFLKMPSPPPETSPPPRAEPDYDLP